MKEAVTTMVKSDTSTQNKTKLSESQVEKKKLSKNQKKSRKTKIKCKGDMDKYRIINCKYKLAPITPKSTLIN